jgi:tetratricopeptide (TPR) repeat protein
MAPVARALGLASVAYWVNGMTGPDSVGVGWIPWVAFAGTAWLATRHHEAVLMPARPLPRLAGAAVLLASLAAASTGANVIRANSSILTAVIWYPQNADTVILAAHDALSADPGRGDYWNYRGLGFQLRARWALAEADFEEAVKRSPYQPNYWINLSRARMFRTQSGDFTTGGAPAALAAARKAIEIEPRISAPHRNYAEVALALGDPSAALTEAVIALDIFADDERIDAILAAAAVALPDRARAVQALDAALAKKPGSATLAEARRQVGGP